MLEDETLAQEIESAAVQMARGAGEILAGHFGRQISVEYKDKAQRDPVTEADKTCQEFLSKEITRKFPGHGILGEETTEDETKPKGNAGEASEAEVETPSPDFLWVLDPLDGTTNFLNGLPVYASSIGVLYQGWPVAAALYIPWPNPQGGFVLHCRKGGGCFADDEPVSVYESDEPGSNRLIGLPGSFLQTARFTGKLRSNAGEMRTTGSIAYELAMTARGVLQYAVIGAPRIWDMAAGALAVMEAQGTVMTRFRGESQWHRLESLVPTWETKTPTMKELRNWMAPLVAGNRQVAPLIAGNIRPRFRPLAKLRHLSRRLRPRKQH